MNLCLFRANGAVLSLAWGKAPGFTWTEEPSALKARKRHESRFQRSPVFPIHHPGAMPQAGIQISAFSAKPAQ